MALLLCAGGRIRTLSVLTKQRTSQLFHSLHGTPASVQLQQKFNPSSTSSLIHLATDYNYAPFRRLTLADSCNNFPAISAMQLSARHLSSSTSLMRQHKERSTSDSEQDGVKKGPQMHETHTSDEFQKLIVIQPEYKFGPIEKPYVPAQYKLDEAILLAESITGWEVHSHRVDTIRQIHNKFLFGKGKTSELTADIKELGDSITGVFVNVPTLTPLQHRTLEELFGKDVFDRFGIVLRIFKERAHTREAKTQVELAEIPYLKMKLFEEMEEEGSFDHQKGGTGKMGGAGETAISAMKEKLNRRQKKLQEQLKEICEKHKVTKEHRSRHAGLPVVAVVGYTNAGKTTLIKALSLDQTMQPKDMLFSTLDTTVHAAKLPCSLKVLFVDTIGFISDLPPELVESFSSTLQDVITADVLVHVTDLSHPQSYAQRANVLQVLHHLDLRPELLENMINVLNKKDIVSTDKREETEDLEGIRVSAINDEGIKGLQWLVQEAVLKATKQKFFQVVLPADGPQLSWLHHSSSTVTQVGPASGEKDGESNFLEVHAILSEANLGKFTAKFGDSVQLTELAEH